MAALVACGPMRSAGCARQGRTPARISFHTASCAIVRLFSVPSLESAGTLPEQLVTLLEQSRHLVLPPRRIDRSFPRVVMSRAHKFSTKKMPVSVN